MDMDHHCFFLNNCVGRNNLKPFLLFLAWMLLGSIYLIGCLLFLMVQRRHAVSRYIIFPGSDLKLLYWAQQIYYTVLVAPGWMQTCVFLLTTATGAAIGVATLLRSQLSLLLAGKTYISSLKHDHSQTSQRRLSCAELWQFLKSQDALSWVWPSWQYNMHVVRRKCL